MYSTETTQTSSQKTGLSKRFFSLLTIIFYLAFNLKSTGGVSKQLHRRKSHHNYFYIYDTGQWKDLSTVSLRKRDDPDEILETTLNGGAGPLVDASRGAYHTDQYQLFLLIYHRALKDHRRTWDPSKATTFLIPYDFSSDVAYYKSCGKSTGNCFEFRKCPLAPRIEDLLLQSPWYRRKLGRDHLLIVGNNYAMDHHIGKENCKKFLTGACYNCSKMAIDDYSFLYAGDHGLKNKGDFWHAIPFPADFHWTRKVVQPFPWENSDRPILVSYIGSARSDYNPARRLRGSIVHYCELHPSDCIWQSYGMNGTRSSFLVKGYDPLQLSARSVFCFQPIGDLMTRKGLFDSLLQGCIPVVFDALTASVMYTWHWEEAFWREISVEFLFHPVAFRYLDPIEALKNMYVNDTASIQRKQALIRSRVFELQFSLEGRYDDLEKPVQQSFGSKNSTTVVGMLPRHRRPANITATGHKIASTWPRSADGSPMRDAFDICIDLALGWHSGLEPDVRNGTVPECWDGWVDPKKNKCMPGEDPSQKKGGK